jgi:hypothetical protein
MQAFFIGANKIPSGKVSDRHAVHAVAPADLRIAVQQAFVPRRMSSLTISRSPCTPILAVGKQNLVARHPLHRC